MGEIFVVADAEAMALHDDMAAEAGFVAVEGDDGLAFGGCEDRTRDSITTRGERVFESAPIESVNSFFDGRHSCDFTPG